MSDILVKIGTNPANLAILPHYITKGGISIAQAKKVKEKETVGGAYNISALGRSKRLITLQYHDVKHLDLVTFQLYDQTRVFWVEITGFGSTKLFEGYCYFRLEDSVTPTVAFDNTILYDFNLYIREL